MDVFSQAILAMDGNPILAPRPFRRYAESIGQGQLRTADQISIQSLQDLAPDLKLAGCMVFRLGRSGAGRYTEFAIAKHANGWGDYFLIDERLFQSIPVTKFEMGLKQEALSVFRILPNYTESSLIALALSSGIIANALGLDDLDSPLISATGNSVHSFTVRPHSSYSEEWEHVKGQVEIDGMFIGERAGVRTLFVVEAKVSSSFSSLSKCKIAYPMLALSSRIPTGMPMVGVYLRVLKNANSMTFYICECNFESSRSEINSLEAGACSGFKIQALCST